MTRSLSRGRWRFRGRNLCALGVVLCGIGNSWVSAQVTPPFFGPGVVAFNPEPSAVFTGTSMTAGATVSADRKYVNLNMQPMQSNVTGVQNFPVFFAGGFVGSQNAGGTVTNRPMVPDPGSKGSSANPTVLVSASGPLMGVLGRVGMTRLAKVD